MGWMQAILVRSFRWHAEGMMACVWEECMAGHLSI